MRDPDRIAPLLRLVERAWRREPDLRLSQLITIAAIRGGWQGGADIFSTEDEVVEAGLRERLRENSSGG